MMIDLSFIIIPESVHVGVDENHNEGVKKVEQQPYIHHLHIGGLGKVVAHVDEHRGQHQHGGQVYSYNRLQIVKSRAKIDTFRLTSKKKALKKFVE